MSQVARQRQLFDDLPEREDLVRVARERGQYTLRDEPLCNLIKEYLAEGRGLKWIAQRCGMHPRTLRRLRRTWTETGELSPVKQRLISIADDILEDGLSVVRDAIEAGELSAAQLSVPIGIIADKRRDWAGEAGLVVEHRHTVDVDAFRRRLEEIRDRAVSGAVTSGDAAVVDVDSQEVAP